MRRSLMRPASLRTRRFCEIAGQLTSKAPAMSPADFSLVQTSRRISRRRRVCRGVRWSTKGGFPEWSGTTVTWDIKPAKDGGEGREVTFNHEGWPEELPAADLASVNYTWGRVVGRLKKYAETGKPAPFFP